MIGATDENHTRDAMARDLHQPRAMRLLLCSVLAMTAACAADDPPSGDPVPTASGSYAGAYAVPVPAELEAAARYPVEHVDWAVAGGVATLHYDLPEGLVGGPVSITLAGPIAAGDTSVTLSGEDGVGTCAAVGTIVTCAEEFAALALPMDQGVIEARAAAEYRGPLADRVAVSNLFEAEPLGVLTFDVTVPALDDDGAAEDD